MSITNSEIDRACVGLDRAMAIAVSKLEQTLEIETDPARLSIIVSKIVEARSKLMAIQEKQLDNASKTTNKSIFGTILSSLPTDSKKIDKWQQQKFVNAILKAEEINTVEQEN